MTHRVDPVTGPLDYVRGARRLAGCAIGSDRGPRASHSTSKSQTPPMLCLQWSCWNGHTTERFLMPDQRYEANRQTIGALLSTTSPRIVVPDWQRSYSWSSREIETFWQDLIAFDERYTGDTIEGEEYFLGSIVLVTGGPTNLLLDGQQRLATATILLSALRDACRSHKDDAATRLQNKYICDFDDATNKTTPMLTLNVYDRDFFRSEIQDESAIDHPRPSPDLRAHTLIRKAREFFESQISSHSNTLGGGQAAFLWNLRIVRVLCDHMSIVAVSSSDEDNASAVFETLNDRGIGLSTPDLLRNLLLRRRSKRRQPNADSRGMAAGPRDS